MLRTCEGSFGRYTLRQNMFFWLQDPIKKVLDANLDREFTVIACGKNAPGKDALNQFETKIGYSLPADFRRFSMSPHDGIYIEAKEEFWPKAPQNEARPFWSFLRGMMTYGFANDIPEWMDIRKQTGEFQKQSGTKFVPFLKVIGNTDVYCFDENQQVRQWNHETNEAALTGRSFVAVFAEEMAVLCERKERRKLELKRTGK